jgi:hypothetical protein
MAQTIPLVVPLPELGEYRRIRKALFGGASWISSKLGGHEVNHEITYDNGKFTLKVTVKFMGLNFDSVKDAERIVNGDENPWTSKGVMV